MWGELLIKRPATLTEDPTLLLAHLTLGDGPGSKCQRLHVQKASCCWLWALQLHLTLLIAAAVPSS